MPTFQCQTCEIIRQIASEYTDPSIICPECRKGAARVSRANEILRNDNVYMQGMARRRDDDDDDDLPPSKRKKQEGGGGGSTMLLILGIVGVVAVCCVCTPIGIAAAIFFPAIQGVRETAARTQSTNNLKNLTLGFHAYHDMNKHFPFNGSNIAVAGVSYSATAKANDPRSGSWAFQICPFIDQPGTFATANRNDVIPTLLCPGRGRPLREVSNGGGAWTDYHINGYLNDPNQASKPDAPIIKRKLFEIKDGTSNTIMVGHGNISTADYKKDGNVTGSCNIFVGGTIGTLRAGNNGAANPGGVTLSRDSDKAPGIGNWGGPFATGGLMAMGDATVRPFAYTTASFSAFLTPEGAENVLLP